MQNQNATQLTGNCEIFQDDATPTSLIFKKFELLVSVVTFPSCVSITNREACTCTETYAVDETQKMQSLLSICLKKLVYQEI